MSARLCSGVHAPLLDVGVHSLRLGLDCCDSLVLLLDEHGHLLEHLRELGKGSFDLLDLDMSLLHLSVGTASSTVSVRVEELDIST